MPANSDHFDVIVIGLGAWGACIARELAERGRRVLGLDRYAPPHDLGSSHGSSRIVRMATTNDPAYTPLFTRAFECMRALQHASGLECFRPVGGLSVASPDHPMNADLVPAYERFDLPYEVFDATELRRRYPWLRVDDDEIGIYDATAGIAWPERVVGAQHTLAHRSGAELRANERVTGWEPTASGLRVTTEQGVYAAERVVIATGAWLPDLLGYALPFAPERQIQMWFTPREHPEWFLNGDYPWLLAACDPPAEYSYAMPDFSVHGIKFGLHRGGVIGHPDDIKRDVQPEEVEAVRVELERRMPALNGALALAKTCIYENSLDHHYIVGPYPAEPRVILAGGGSGRGFAMSFVVGEVVADLLAGEELPGLALLSPARFEEAVGVS
jgi:sarcosine oxidase